MQRRARWPSRLALTPAAPRRTSTRARCHHREGGLVGQQQGDDAGAVRRCCCRTSASTPSRASCSCRTCSPAPIPRSGSMHASSSSMPGTRCSSAICCAGREASELAGFKPQFTVVNLPSFRADPKRHGVRSETVIACNFAKRLVLIGGTLLRGRDQEVGVHLSQLRDARSGRDADALLGQRRHRRRRRRLLRPVGHRQDHAVGRSQAHPARRRRARLVAERASTISRAAATPRPSASPRKPSPRSGTRPTASARCSRTSS